MSWCWVGLLLLVADCGLGLADVPVLFIVVGCVYYGLGGFCLWFGWFRFWAVCLLQVGWGVCSVLFCGWCLRGFV